jgi:hypothetical protein
MPVSGLRVAVPSIDDWQPASTATASTPAVASRIVTWPSVRRVWPVLRK